MSIDCKKVAMFAREWNKAGATKVCFTNLEELYGIKFISSESGKITDVTLDGESIGLPRGLILRSKLAFGRVWFDFEIEKFEFDGLDPLIANCIIDEIRSKINGDAYHD